MKQLTLIPKPNTEHGGSLTHEKRKSLKPIDSKKVIHLVLKAKPGVSLRKHNVAITELLHRQAKLADIKIYDLSIQSNHIHHAIYVKQKANYNGFIRATTGLLARKFGRGLWKYRPYTRNVNWGKDYKKLKKYIEQNESEALGRIPYQPRKPGTLPAQ